MLKNRHAVFVFALMSAGTIFGAALDLALWPEGKTPDFQSTQSKPLISVTMPTNRVSNALMIVAPGGSYEKWSDWEGKCAGYFNSHGMATALLRYRTPRPANLPKHVSAWQDAQRAVRLCRLHAAEWGVSPDNIGFIGFSAGGNLALLAATSSQTSAYARIDSVDDLPCHVNWAIVCYPAYVLSDCVGYDGTNRKNGNPLDLEIDPIFKFDALTPPMCFLHGDADDYSPMGSVRAYHRLRTMGIPSEMHVFAKRGHADLPRGMWQDVVWRWLDKMGWTGAVEQAHFKPLKYNTEGMAYMKAGLCSSAVVGDFDGDGDDDVYLDAYGQTPLGGTWYFENISPPGTKGAPTAFKQRVRRGDCAGGIRCTLADGTSAVVSRRKVNYMFEKDPAAFEPLGGNLPDNVHHGKVRANYWRLRDFDGDGRDDIVVGIGDWREYGWDNRYSPNGIWTNAQIHGYVYVVRNEGCGHGHEKWGEPRMLRIENGDPVESFGNASPMLEDWDGDGDLDLLTGDFRDNWLYFENIGTRTEPVYTSGRLLRGVDGKRLRADLCITRPFAYDWDKDGRMDFLAGEEDGRLGFYRNTGKVEKGLPVFERPDYLKAARDYVHFGSLSTPWAVDWDGDGDQDIIAGNSAGYVAFFENLSGPGVAEPKWEEPKLLSCEKGGVEPITRIPGTDSLFSYDPFRIIVGPNGSIQGPCEATYGYTCLSAEDWDGDDDIDIMLNNTWGKIILLRNTGTRTSPKLGAPEGVEVEWEGGQPELKWGWFQASKTPNAKEIVTQWRTTPVMHDMNGDGLMDLILVDTEGFLAFFERFRKSDGALALKSPRRAFLDDATGVPMGVSGWRGNGKGKGGGAGRRKVCIVDWDGDGKKDIVMNSARVGGNAVLWRQTKSGDGTWSFSKVGDLTDDRLEWHSSSPCACDFDGNGVPDLLLGAEDGFFYHLVNPRSESREKGN